MLQKNLQIKRAISVTFELFEKLLRCIPGQTQLEVKLRARYIAGFVAASLLLCGCGNVKNPLYVSVHVPKIISGLWDGFTVLVALIYKLFKPHKYALYGHGLGHYATYWIGFVLGVLALLAVLSALFGGYRYRRTRTVRRAY
jgi:hypothetical protein